MITGLYAGILALIFVLLSARAVRARITHRVSLGDGGNEEVTRALRVHGNFAEYAPLSLVLMMLYEMQAGSLYVLHSIGIMLVAGRLLHIVGLGQGIMPARVMGTALTLISLIVLGVLLSMHGLKVAQVL